MSSDTVCWEFSNREDPPIPVTPIFLRNAQDKDVEWQEVSLKVDTGFAGAVGLPSDVIQALRLSPLGKVLITTSAGERRVSYFQLLVKNEEWCLTESLAYAIETTRALGGRSLLTGRKWLLDFREEKFCHYRLSDLG